MTISQTVFLALYLVLALLGLFMTGVAVDTPIVIFGLGLILFGVLSAFGILKRHADALDAGRAR